MIIKVKLILHTGDYRIIKNICDIVAKTMNDYIDEDYTNVDLTWFEDYEIADCILSLYDNNDNINYGVYDEKYINSRLLGFRVTNRDNLLLTLRKYSLTLNKYEVIKKHFQ